MIFGKDSEEYIELYRQKLKEHENLRSSIDSLAIEIDHKRQELEDLHNDNYKMEGLLISMRSNIIKIIETGQDITEIKLKSDFHDPGDIVNITSSKIYTSTSNKISLGISNPNTLINVYNTK